MKKTLIASLAAFGLLANPASAAINLLNGGFESGDLTGWTPNNATVVNSSTDPVRTGSFSARLTVPGGGGVPEVNQQFAASAGDEFNFSGWMLTQNALPAGPTFGLFKIVFRDGANGELQVPAGNVSIGGAVGPGNPGAESTPFLNNGSAANTWIFSEVQAVAPAGTAAVQFLALNVDFAGGENPMYFDDIAAVQIPEPSSTACVGLGLLGLMLRRRR